MWRLIEAIVEVASSELTLASMPDGDVEVAREMVDAQNATLGVIGDDGGLRELVDTGFDDDTAGHIGHCPKATGFLGLLISEREVLRLDDLADHPASVGFPPRHPPMDTFLGVPIEVRGKVCGDLYLSNRRSGHGVHRRRHRTRHDGGGGGRCDDRQRAAARRGAAAPTVAGGHP